MPYYNLKLYRRLEPGNTLLTILGDWIVSAKDDETAKTEANKVLTDFKPDDDYAMLLNDNGKMVWESAHHG